jgi:uncharacterized membrane-anchored protein
MVYRAERRYKNMKTKKAILSLMVISVLLVSVGFVVAKKGDTCTTI